jgi:hypothetical protein
MHTKKATLASGLTPLCLSSAVGLRRLEDHLQLPSHLASGCVGLGDVGGR